MRPLRVLVCVLHALVVVTQREKENDPDAVYHTRVTRFLQEAQPGFCAGTDDAGEIVNAARCETAGKGNWALMRSQVKSWETAVATCQQRCSLCKNCHYLSISLDQRDCSWFRHCDLSKLHTRDPSVAIAGSFKSAASGVARRAPLSTARSWTGALQEHNLLCRTHGGGFGVPSGPLRVPFTPKEEGDVYQFGVAEGYSLRNLLTIMPTRTAWAFDTFAGMPDADRDEPTFDVHWRRGQFKPGGRASTPDQAARLPLLGPALNARVRTVVGPFKHSLVTGLAGRRGMRPAAYVDIDSDLYSSARQALTWLFDEKLIQVCAPSPPPLGITLVCPPPPLVTTTHVDF